MDREYLFRGKRVDNGEWVFGDLRQYVNMVGCEDFYEIDTMSDTIGYGHSYKVIPETVNQFTGLTDMSGNKIFDGDIIKVVTEDTHEERFIEVCIGEFTDDGYGDLFIGAYLKYGGFTVSAGQIKECGSNGVEIVGNIYDNPELLTDKT